MRDGMVREQEAGSLPSLESDAARLSLHPGWIRRSTPLLSNPMRSVFVPHQWKYSEAKALMVEAAQVLGTDVAERRNFIMRNPIPDNDFSTLRTIICAYQTMLPGEKAMSHRHSPHAMRVLLESDGAYSIVNGHKHPMNSGDIVLTPGGCWHGHGHEGNAQAFWVDGLDLPLTHLLEPMFYEPHPAQWEPVVNDSPHSPMRFAKDDIAQALKHAADDDNGFFGPTIPLDTSSMPTVTLKVHSWKRGWRSRPQRQTPNVVYVVMQGSGTSLIGEHRMEWSFGDVITVPGWVRAEHQAHEDSLLCSISDEQLMRWALYHRQEALD